MSKLKISWVQPNFQQGPQDLNAYYLPYSIGIIWSYLKSHDDIAERFELGDIIWRREDISAAADRLKDSAIVAFSTYVWNHKYNYALAKAIKQRNPHCFTVFGGPEPAITNPEIFRQEPFMDVIIKLEGEIKFLELLRAWPDNYQGVSGLLINVDGTVLDTGAGERIQDLDQIPSPYLTGVFDQLIKDHPSVVWNATLETNRGCPYQCTFCDWGSLTYSKVKKFGLERVFAELDWIGEHCGFVTIADANFGMFVERDNLIVDRLIEVQKRWGRLDSFSMTWAKNQRNEVVDIVKKLIRESPKFGQGLTVSVQSMDNDVLENIRRRNLDQHKIDEIFDLCDRNNVPVYTEVILGLPGETATSWRENFWRIFRAGNHTGVNILQAQLLENAEMNLLQKKLWQLESVPIYDYMSGSTEDLELPESVDVVIGTREIPRDQMLQLLTWNTFIQTFHINGLTTYIARYLNKAQDIDYGQFYDDLWHWCREHTWLSTQLQQTEQYYSNWFQHGRAGHPRIGRVEVFGWNLVHRVTLMMYHDRMTDRVLQDIAEFLSQRYIIDQDILRQLIDFQSCYVLDSVRFRSLPITRNFDFDFLGFIQDRSALHVPVRYQFSTTEDQNISDDHFLENIYFARKRNFGKSIISRISD